MPKSQIDDFHKFGSQCRTGATKSQNAKPHFFSDEPPFRDAEPRQMPVPPVRRTRGLLLALQELFGWIRAFDKSVCGKSGGCQNPKPNGLGNRWWKQAREHGYPLAVGKRDNPHGCSSSTPSTVSKFPLSLTGFCRRRQRRRSFATRLCPDIRSLPHPLPENPVNDRVFASKAESGMRNTWKSP